MGFCALTLADESSPTELLPCCNCSRPLFFHTTSTLSGSSLRTVLGQPLVLTAFLGPMRSERFLSTCLPRLPLSLRLSRPRTFIKRSLVPELDGTLLSWQCDDSFKCRSERSTPLNLWTSVHRYGLANSQPYDISSATHHPVELGY
jgi:hypothetical protein